VWRRRKLQVIFRHKNCISLHSVFRWWYCFIVYATGCVLYHHLHTASGLRQSYNLTEHIIIRLHCSTTYVVVAYCYRWSSRVCQSCLSVGLSWLWALQKCWTFGLWTWVGPRNRVLDGVPDSPCRGEISRGKGAAHCKVYTYRDCVPWAEPIKMPFGMWTPLGSRKHVLERVHIGATWRTWLNGPYVAGSVVFLSNYFDCLLLLTVKV